jgi:hypothetical protein
MCPERRVTQHAECVEDIGQESRRALVRSRRSQRRGPRGGRLLEHATDLDDDTIAEIVRRKVY